LSGGRAEGDGQASKCTGDQIIKRGVNIVSGPFDEFGGRAAGENGGKDFVFPQIFGGQGVEVEGKGEEENCE
jgi:hypothetical protein